MVKVIFLAISVLVALVQAHPPDEVPNYLRVNEEENRLRASDIKFRLSDATYPLHYDLKIVAFQNPAKTFNGDVWVTFKARRAVKEFEINQQNIEVVSYDLYQVVEEGENILIEATLEDDSNYEKFIFKLGDDDELVSTSTYLLHIQYTGTVHDDMRGFYESYYLSSQGRKVYLDTTHFGQLGRRLVPCWDETIYKATWKFQVHRNRRFFTNSITNAILEKTERDPGNDNIDIDFYKATSPIPAYILALVVSDFQARSDGTPTNHKFSIYARPSAYEQTQFAYDILPKIVNALNEWTGHDYFKFKDVDKMDMAAIPDFSAGAMENWGLLIHREVNILVGDNYTTTWQKFRIADVISHEAAHQWFGDLVTANWWDVTWINEGFASYFEYKGLEPVHPEWDVMSEFVAGTFQPAMAADASPGAHPMQNKDIYNYADIRTMFTTISYEKAASVIRMIHNLMGDKFQTGVREYLETYQYATATPTEFFAILERLSPELFITDIFKSYNDQAGVPIITAFRDGKTVTLTQKRFFIDRANDENTTKWFIPITYITETKESDDTLAGLTFFPAGFDSITIEVPSNANFYLLNVQSFGYYRINYDTENWIQLGKMLRSKNHGGIHVLNRAQIVDDLFQLARANYVTYEFVFDILFEYIKTERAYVPWTSFLNGLSYLQQRIPNEKYKKEFEAFVADALTPTYQYLMSKNVDDLTFLEKLLRINIANWACKYGVAECEKTADDLFYQYLRTKSIDVDLKPAVYCHGLRTSTGNWYDLWQEYVTTNYATEQATILTALGCSKKPADLNTFMDQILTEDIRPQDKSAAYNRAYTGNLENVEIVLDYIIANFEKWGEVMNLGSTLSDLSTRFTNDREVAKLKVFATVAPISQSVKNQLLRAVERSEANIEWDSKRLPEMTKFWKKYQGDASSTMISFSALILSMIAILVLN